MKTLTMQKKTGIVMMLCLFFVVIGIKGCRKNRSPVNPDHSQQHQLSFKFAGDSDLQAKATGLALKIEGLNADGLPNGEDIIEESHSSPEFPLDIPMMLYDPPCRWRITLTVTLQREPPRTAQGDIDVCSETHIELTLDTFEPFLLLSGANSITAPDSADAHEAIDVRCGPIVIDAPDSDRYPMTATLTEEGGQSVNGEIGSDSAVSGTFADPHSPTSTATERTFTCTISDGRSSTQSFTLTIIRHPDRDGDGVIDETDNCPDTENSDQADSDGDGPGDVCDICPYDADNDIDEDGLCADEDDCPNDPDNDADGDTICGDVDVCPKDADNDLDGDGLCGDVDACPKDADNDLDGDGLCGDVDACPNDASNDLDGDGVCGSVDNCPTVANADQTDTDGDTVGDVCDNCTSDANTEQTDADGDTVGNVCDNCPSDANTDQTDTDGDTIGDVCDNCTSDANTDQDDVDGNGIGDVCDPCTVTNNVDSGTKTLRNIINSGACSTITFTSGLPTITLTTGELQIPAGTLTIDGGSGVIISGNLTSRVFYVNSGADVTFQNLTITDGRITAGAGGGGILNEGAVTIANNCLVSNNTSVGAAGGIYNRGGLLTVDGTVSDNTVTWIPGGADGGGIFNGDGGTVTVNGTVSGNDAADEGGGIRNNNAGSALIISSTGIVDNNTSTYSGGGIVNQDGAITVSGRITNNTSKSGGGISSSTGTMTFGTGNLIQGNTATDGIGHGGGMYNNSGLPPGGAPPDYGTGNTWDNCAPIGPGCP